MSHIVSPTFKELVNKELDLIEFPRVQKLLDAIDILEGLGFERLDLIGELKILLSDILDDKDLKKFKDIVEGYTY